MKTVQHVYHDKRLSQIGTLPVRRVAIVLSFLTMTMGCQSMYKHTQLPQAKTPSATVAFGDYTESSDVQATGKKPSLAETRWQSFYSDARLKELIQLGLENNRNLQSALINIQKARAQYQISQVQDIPAVGLNAGVSRSGRFEGSAKNNYSVGLGISTYEFDFWGRIRSLKDQVLANYLSTQYGKDAAQIGLISQIAQSWVSLSYAQAQLELAEQTFKSQRKSLELNTKRFKAGIDPELTVTQAKTQVAAAKLAILSNKTHIKKAKNALALLVGVPVPKRLLPPTKVKHIVSTQVFNASLPSALLTYRPDLRQAQMQLKAAGANIDVARAAYYPNISLTGNLGTASQKLGKLFESGSFSWSFGPSISLPIFDSGKRDANLKVAKLDQKQALLAYESSIQTAFREVADVLADRATLAERISIQKQLLAAAKRNHELSQLRFKAGIDSYLNVLESQRSLFNSQEALLNLQQGDLISQIQLYQVLGGGAQMTKPKKQ